MAAQLSNAAATGMVKRFGLVPRCAGEEGL
jgi:hypothetical protein